jgi:hypothetical protein
MHMVELNYDHSKSQQFRSLRTRLFQTEILLLCITELLHTAYHLSLNHAMLFNQVSHNPPRRTTTVLGVELRCRARGSRQPSHNLLHPENDMETNLEPGTKITDSCSKSIVMFRLFLGNGRNALS